MVLAGVDFWYDNYGLWAWQAKNEMSQLELEIAFTVELVSGE